MANLEADTHGMIVTGTGGTVAQTETSIGTITLPAGGPWKIFQLFCQPARATATSAEATGGHFRLNAPEGDLEPQPSPARYPAGWTPASLTAGSLDAQEVPLELIDVEFTAPGKSRIEFLYTPDDTQAAAPQIVTGCIFGKTRPIRKPFTKMDRARGQITNTAADTSIATVTLSENAKKIIAVCGFIAGVGILTAGEEATGYFRLASDDVKMPPMQLPFSAVYGAGLSTPINISRHQNPVWIPVNIPVEGGARIDTFVDMVTAVTNALEVQIYLAYE